MICLPVFAALGLIFGLLSGAHAEDASHIYAQATIHSMNTTGVSLTVSCSFNTTVSGSDTNGGDHVTLVMSKTPVVNSSAVEMASISAFAGNVAKTEGFGGTVDGSIDRKRQKSFLTVKFEHIPWKEFGEFECESTSIDPFGHCTHLKKKVHTNISSVDVNMLAQFIRDPLAYGSMKDVKAQLTECKTSMENFREKFATAVKVDPKQVYWITEMFNAPSFHALKTFNTSSFYALTDTVTSCTDLGGYLAEINTEDEFKFLNATLQREKYKLPLGVSFMACGAGYETLTGPFKLDTHPEDPIYIGHFAPKEPHRSSLAYRWLLIKFVSKQLNMYDGIRNAPDVKYLCEITV